MLIIGDEAQSRGKLPWVTFSLVAINIVVFCCQRFGDDTFGLGFCLVPKEISTLTDLTKPEHVRAKIPDHYYYDHNERKIAYRDATVTIPQAPGPFPIF